MTTDGRMLYIDTEKSSARLKVALTRAGISHDLVDFVRIDTEEEWNKLKEKAFVRQTVTVKNGFMGTEVLERVFLSKWSIDRNIKFVSLDTASSLNQKLRQNKRRKVSRKLNWDDWDLINNQLIETLLSLTTIDATLIVNCHPKQVKDDDSGIIYEVPQLNGSAAEEYPKQFDFTFRSSVLGKGKSASYIWATRASERYFAKDITDTLDEMMPQNFSVVANACESAGIKNPKMLIIGKSGSGKTSALVSLFKHGEAQDADSGLSQAS